MKKKVFFVLSSFRAGGAEKVFWLLSQSFNKSLFDVTVVLLTTADSFYSTELQSVRVIDLKTIKASRSFVKLYSLIRMEKPDVIFCTGGQVNLLLGILSLGLKTPTLIARPTNQDNSKYVSLMSKAQAFLTNGLFRRFDKVICQSEEIKSHIVKKYGIPLNRLVVIPNPISSNTVLRNSSIHSDIRKLIVVARLKAQKGIERLLDVINDLPENYHLTIVGDGPLKEKIANRIDFLNLKERVRMIGVITNVLEVVSQHDVFVLPSFIEGFPNVIIESLSVGTPVVSFSVGGISEIIRNDFNGFIVEQDDLDEFIQRIRIACEKAWDSNAIREDIHDRFGLEKVTARYEQLVLE